MTFYWETHSHGIKMRYKITLEYDGTPFIGWQKQEGQLSVQGVLETALKTYFRTETFAGLFSRLTSPTRSIRNTLPSPFL